MNKSLVVVFLLLCSIFSTTDEKISPQKCWATRLLLQLKCYKSYFLLHFLHHGPFMSFMIFFVNCCLRSGRSFSKNASTHFRNKKITNILCSKHFLHFSIFAKNEKTFQLNLQFIFWLARSRCGEIFFSFVDWKFGTIFLLNFPLPRITLGKAINQSTNCVSQLPRTVAKVLSLPTSLLRL